jgi:hypothetical protein
VRGGRQHEGGDKKGKAWAAHGRLLRGLAQVCAGGRADASSFRKKTSRRDCTAPAARRNVEPNRP